MPLTGNWADKYVENKKTAAQAIALIKPAQRVFIGSSCGEPQHLVRELSEASNYFRDIEINRLMTMETTPLTLIADKTRDQSLNIRSFYLGSAKPQAIARNKRFITPINLSAVPRLFKSRLLPIHVALIQVSPPDDFGWMSLGVSVDITLAAALSADLVIAQVNAHMPRVLGRSFLHVNEVDVFVEYDEPLLTIGEAPELKAANDIGRLIARLIEDGSTLEIGLGSTHQATLLALADKNDLGIHTQYITRDIMHLFSRGVITNRKKGLNDGKLVAAGAIGNEELYEFLNDNPAIEFYPSDYVNDPAIIARHNKMVSMNVAMSIDLTGQVAADALPYNHFSGVTGMLDFLRGAVQSPGGKSIMMLPATAIKGTKSRIVPQLDDEAVVVPRGDVQHVVTEYGVVNLFGKSLQERAIAMISIAHPAFRDELFHAAKKMGLLSSERTLNESIHGVYPIHLEETVDIGNQVVTIRPAKPVDERRIQEHFYSLDKDDVVSRFFHEKSSFVHDDVKGVSLIDYIKDLTIVAVVGEVGFGQVVGIGECLLDPASNEAEVAFSISKPFQKKGLGKLLLNKLAFAARENGISGLMAYTSAQNRGMVKLFKSLPYKVDSFFDGEMLKLSCKFNQPL
ncbi:MAG: acetyl-CoA hydrolase/transferase family protein [Deltaproteobacteria bacterium]|jgi:acyl-CoA hydrolase/GNAT superfamily N-acetyltransferase|nr:acetyl-CoA hydrolase/transferase family protein [Deltaproteobacteria bacterium]